MFGITKGALPFFGPTQFTNHVIALDIIHQVLYVYLHLLDSNYERKKGESTFFNTTTLESNISLFLLTRFKSASKIFIVDNDPI
jgi:hypothetical protein